MLRLLAIALSFLVTVIALPFWIRRAKEHGLSSMDMHKADKRRVADLGGIVVVGGFIIGMMYFIAYEIFIVGTEERMLLVLGLTSSILIATIIGLIDDILGWKIGMRQYQKMLLSVLISLPMVVINAGHSMVTVPFMGKMDVGLIYPFLLVPLGIVGASNGFNIIAGYNGLEAGMGIIILSALGVMSWSLGAFWVAIIAFCMVAALLAFLIFNKYPAKVFPGDTLTYSVGALIAITVIIGNIEKFGLILFSLFIIEGFLKARGKFQKESFAKALKDGSLVNQYDKWYGLEHIAVSLLGKIKNRVYEYEVVFVLWLAQAVVAVSTLAYFFL